MASNRLLSRIEKLEAAIPPVRQDLVIFRLIVQPGVPADYMYGECEGRSFDRMAGESIEEFQSRIALATRPERSSGKGRHVILFNAPSHPSTEADL